MPKRHTTTSILTLSPRERVPRQAGAGEGMLQQAYPPRAAAPEASGAKAQGLSLGMVTARLKPWLSAQELKPRTKEQGLGIRG